MGEIGRNGIEEQLLRTLRTSELALAKKVHERKQCYFINERTLLYNKFTFTSMRRFNVKNYFLTAYDDTGEKLLDETFIATNDKEAKKIAEKQLHEKNYHETTHRLVSSDATLLLFHR